MKRHFPLLLALGITLAAHSQTHPSITDSLPSAFSLPPSFAKAAPAVSIPAPRPFGWLRNVPGDLVQMGAAPFKKKGWLPFGAVLLTSALIIPHDQQISNEVARISNNVGLNRKAEFDRLLAVNNKTLLRTPDNLNTSFYEMGEGVTTMALAGGFFLAGKLHNNPRSLQTASDLTEAFLSMGITIQVLKHISGRQAPTQATAPGGQWHFLPSIGAYQRNSTYYGAFPSGHLATMMATVTVLAEDYPEKKWIRPVGYLLTGLTGWAMVNNGVHWAGDFPLGIAVGYLAGKITTARHQKKQKLKSVPIF